MECNKRCFISRKEAKDYIKETNLKGNIHLTNAYYCDQCSHYHVTSMPKQKSRDYTRHLKNKKTMSNKISWQPCDKMVTETIGEKTYTHRVERELVCENPEVEKVWFTGSADFTSKPPKMFMHLNAICKDGFREEIKCPDQDDKPLESQAIEWMENILDDHFKTK